MIVKSQPYSQKDDDQFLVDVRALVNYMETEYVGPDIGRVLQRLRKRVGYGDAGER